MQTLNLIDAVSVEQIFEQISRMLPFRVANLAALNGVVPEYPNQLALVDGVGVYSYHVATTTWRTAESTALELELNNLVLTVTNLTTYVTEGLTELGERVENVSVTAGQVNGLAEFVRATTLTGLDLTSGATITAGLSVLQALGRLQRQITDLSGTLSEGLTTIGDYVDTELSGLSTSLNGSMNALSLSLNGAMTDLQTNVDTQISGLTTWVNGQISTVNTALGVTNTNLSNLSNALNLRSRANVRIDPTNSAAAIWDYIYVATAGRTYTSPTADLNVGDEFYVAVDSVVNTQVNFGAMPVNGATIGDGLFVLDIPNRVYVFKYISATYGYKAS